MVSVLKYIKWKDRVTKKKYYGRLGFNEPFSEMKASKRKINKGIENENNMTYKLDLINIYIEYNQNQNVFF